MLRIWGRIILGIDIASFKQGYRKNFLIHTFIYKKKCSAVKKKLIHHIPNFLT